MKKRLTQSQHNQQNSKHNNPKRIKSNDNNPVTKVEATHTEYLSPQCSSDNTSSTSDIIHYNNNNIDGNNNIDEALDEDFWSEVLSGGDDSGGDNDAADHQNFQFSTLTSGTSTSMCHIDAFSMDFWYDVYTRAEELTDLPPHL